MTPAGQRWTRRNPTEPGWYWYRGSLVLETDGIEVVHVFEDDGALFAETVNNYSEPVSDFDGEWQGPLAPNEATE